MWKIIKKVLGIEDLEQKVSRLSEDMEELKAKIKETTRDEQAELLDALEGRMTTSEIAEIVGKSRSWTSFLLNKLERTGRIREAGKKGREVLYERADGR